MYHFRVNGEDSTEGSQMVYLDDYQVTTLRILTPQEWLCPSRVAMLRTLTPTIQVQTLPLEGPRILTRKASIWSVNLNRISNCPTKKHRQNQSASSNTSACWAGVFVGKWHAMFWIYAPPNSGILNGLQGFPAKDVTKSRWWPIILPSYVGTIIDHYKL